MLLLGPSTTVTWHTSLCHQTDGLQDDDKAGEPAVLECENAQNRCDHSRDDDGGLDVDTAGLYKLLVCIAVLVLLTL